MIGRGMVHRADSARQNLIGISLMTAGMASGAAVDATVKAMSGLVDTRLITAVVGFGMAAIFSTAALRQGRGISLRDLANGPVLLRTSCEVIGVFLTVLALSLVSLAEVTALVQSVPLLVTIGAVMFLGERARASDWLALLVGVLGMLLIVRPTSEGFQPALLIAVAAAMALAARDLASRAVPPRISTIQLGVWGGAALGIGSLALYLVSGSGSPELSLRVLGGFALMVLLASTTFFCITAAMRVGSVAVISPFRYTRLPFGVFLGMVLFAETLDAGKVLGAAVIMLSGLVILWRESTR